MTVFPLFLLIYSQGRIQLKKIPCYETDHTDLYTVYKTRTGRLTVMTCGFMSEELACETGVCYSPGHTYRAVHRRDPRHFNHGR